MPCNVVCWFMYAAWLSAFEELRNPMWRFVYSTHGYSISMLIAAVGGWGGVSQTVHGNSRGPVFYASVNSLLEIRIKIRLRLSRLGILNIL
jgi:hypothetical protein